MDMDIHGGSMKYFFACMTFVCFILPLCAQQNTVVRLGPDLEVRKLHQNVWMHVSYADLPGYGRVGANGLVILAGPQVIIIDTPWNDALTEQLCKWIEAQGIIVMKEVVVTHHHDDNLGGLRYLIANGYKSFAYSETVKICKEKRLPVPETGILNMRRRNSAGVSVEFWYPGPGHTEYGLCAYIPEAKILFGGCLVKALSNTSLGNTEEANLAAWPQTLMDMKKKCPDTLIVVPGHGEPGGLELLDHTLKLLENRR